jgi:hypothetical protein
VAVWIGVGSAICVASSAFKEEARSAKSRNVVKVIPFLVRGRFDTWRCLIPLPGKRARQLPFDVDDMKRGREDGHFHNEIRAPQLARRA